MCTNCLDGVEPSTSTTSREAPPALSLGCRIGAGLAALLVLAPRPASPSCDVIPSRSTFFRSTLGTTDRPFARPGDEVEIRLTRKRAARRDHDCFWQRTPGSDWVGLAAADEELAAELLAEAIEANA